MEDLQLLEEQKARAAAAGAPTSATAAFQFRQLFQFLFMALLHLFSDIHSSCRNIAMRVVERDLRPSIRP